MKDTLQLRRAAWITLASLAVAAALFTACEQPTGGGDGDSAITYTAEANGDANVSTTAIVFTFSKAVSDLATRDIFVSSGTGGVTKGDLTGSGRVWSLEVSVVTAGNVRVSIDKLGIDDEAKTVSVFKNTGSGEGGFTDLDALIAYLNEHADPNHTQYPESAPLEVKASLDLSGSNWNTLRNAIQSYVNLDLSGSTGREDFYIYDDVIATGSGMRYVVEFILPDTAKAIKRQEADDKAITAALKLVKGANVESISMFAFGVDDPRGPFTFSNLETLDLPEVTSISIGAFRCAKKLSNINFPKLTYISWYVFQECNLTSVSFPEVTSIDMYAFGECVNLVSVDFPKATDISIGSFQGCTSLVNVEFPEATSISGQVFRDCLSLTTVSLPKATDISSAAFASCSSLASVTLGAEAPNVGYEIFRGIDEPQTVTVRFPASGAASYGEAPEVDYDSRDNWGNAFRGGGWHKEEESVASIGNSYDLNLNIRLIYETF